MLSPESISRLEILRQKALTSDLTSEEEREVVTIIREGRIAAATVSAKSRAAKTPVSGADVLAKLQAALANHSGAKS